MEKNQFAPLGKIAALSQTPSWCEGDTHLCYRPFVLEPGRSSPENMLPHFFCCKVAPMSTV